MGRPLYKTITDTSAIKPGLQISHNITYWTYHHFRCCTNIPDIPCHRSELVSPFRLIQVDDRYIPPIVDPEDPEIRNSDNTVLFLMSCYQYIMIAIILSVGRPFRQPMVQNGTPDHSPCLFLPFRFFANDSSVHGNHYSGSAFHHNNNPIPTILARVNFTINIHDNLVRVLVDCDRRRK